ncbi:MAG TPA: hypothetical protein VGP31_17005 [Planosporangium sp.]|jgi:predicted dehydrogenase|nr:hypothetical protein [Planosporangium sp.]
MVRTLLIGFGRAGAGLHWNVLRRLRGRGDSRHLFADDPPIVWDPAEVGASAAREGLGVVDSLTQAAAQLDPAGTVVHLCAPPATRLVTLRDVAAAGFRLIMVEKPLASNAAEVHEIARLRREYGLHLLTVAQWLHSALTLRLARLVAADSLGALRGISVLQRKPRMMRSLDDVGHPSAFDVELPHSVGVALRLAGDADVAGAAGTDMRVGEVVVPRMGSARLLLEHLDGPVTEIFSDLTSPVRERRIELTFDAGRAVGHYPGSRDDHYATLSVLAGRERTDEVLFDDSLSAFFVHAYRRFAAGDDFADDFALAVRVVELLDAAKRRCRPGTSDPVAGLLLEAGATAATLAEGSLRHAG